MLCCTDAAWTSSYTRRMTFDQRKLLILSAWAAIISTTGIILTIERPTMWIFIACVALIPAAVANWLWTGPELTLSQLVRKQQQ